MDSVRVKSETGLSFDVDDFTHLPTLKKHRYKNLYNFLKTCTTSGLILIQPDPNFGQPILKFRVVLFSINYLFVYLKC
jgi:hypothetical protein